jgi:hypothetical protein
MQKFYGSFLILILSGTLIQSLAQQNLELKRQTLLKISPLSLLEPETVVLQGGAEYFFNEKISVQTEVGLNGGVFGIPSGRKKNSEMSVLRVKAELKLHTKKNYWGLEVFTVQKDFLRVDDFVSASPLAVYYNHAKIDFQVYGAAVKFGRAIFTSSNLLIERFVSLGIRTRFREVRVLEFSQNQNPEFTESFDFLGDRYRFQGWDAVPHVSVGFKVGILSVKRNE